MRCFFEDYNIELRCTYMMSNCALKYLPKIFNLPVENSLRTIIMYTKTKKTDKKYPRRYNEILKKEI